jgi:hypothetical protein
MGPGFRLGIVAASFALLTAVSPPRAAAQSSADPQIGIANGSVAGMQSALMADPSSRDQVMSLQDDPQMQAILNDPALMRAVQAGDVGALLADPRIQALDQNPTVRALVDQQQPR